MFKPFYTVSQYFLKLSEEFISYKSMFVGSIFHLENRDRSDVCAFIDTIPSRSAYKVFYKMSKHSTGFCGVSQKRFERGLLSRSRKFNSALRTEIKSNAASLQLVDFKESISRKTLSKASFLVAEHLGLTPKKYKPTNLVGAVSTFKLQTSAGFPWFTKKARVLENIIDSTEHFINNFDAVVLAKFPTYVAYRVQQRLSDVKLRLIYVYSAIIVALEQLFLKPIIDDLLQRVTPYCIGNNGSILVKRYVIWNSRSNIVSLDWSSFDWRASKLLIQTAFLIIKNSFQLTENENKIFDFVSDYFIHTPIITNVNNDTDFRVITKQRGIPSGSSFTNFIGTIVNMLIVYCYLIDKNYEIKPELLAFLGDDVIIATNSNFSITDFSVWSRENFDMEVSISKSQIHKPGEKVFFLGGLIDAEGRYCNPELILYQICLTTSDLFIKCKNSQEHTVRLWNKICSICFKYSDGYLVFDAIWPEIEGYLNTTYRNDFYVEVYSRATVPGSDDKTVGQLRSYLTMREFGWKIQ